MRYVGTAIAVFFSLLVQAQINSLYLLKPDRVFAGETMHTGWVVLVKGDSIKAAGSMNFKSNCKYEYKSVTCYKADSQSHKQGV